MPLSDIPDPQALGHITTSFEINDKVKIGALGGIGLGVIIVGCYMMANPGPGYEKEALLIGSLTAGAGLSLTLVQDLVINSRKAQRINMAAREALINVAQQRHPEEEIDIRNVSVEYVTATGKTHKYNASGIVIKKNY